MGSVSSVVDAAGSALGGISAYQTGKSQNKQYQADAAATIVNRRLEAERIRKQGKAVQSSAVAQAAENGLDVSTGVPTVINDQIARDAEHDAWMTILTGEQEGKALRTAGRNARKQGNTALGMGLLKAGGQLADGFSGKVGGGKAG